MKVGLEPDWGAVRAELLAMAERDLTLRAALAKDGSLFQGYHRDMQAVHRANAERLAALLTSHGWPGEAQVGADGAEAAWLIVQHAIGWPSFQREALVALQGAVARGDAPALHAAMLEDRVRTLEGRPQRYGTQFDWDEDGRMSPLPSEDPRGLDERRRGLGLRPIEAETIERRRLAELEGERPPRDPDTRRREMLDWLRAVGWRR